MINKVTIVEFYIFKIFARLIILSKVVLEINQNKKLSFKNVRVRCILQR